MRPGRFLPSCTIFLDMAVSTAWVAPFPVTADDREQTEGYLPKLTTCFADRKGKRFGRYPSTVVVRMTG